MTRIVRALVLIAMLSQAACFSVLVPWETPEITPPSGTPLDSSIGSQLTGIYKVGRGNAMFGDSLVGLWVKDRFCLYAGNQVIFIDNMCAYRADSSIDMHGYYRFVQSDRWGYVYLTIKRSAGGEELCTKRHPQTFDIEGSYGDPYSQDPILFTMSRAKDIKQDRHFYVIGNCAGGRNSERLGRSENSIEMARFAGYLGCNGIEIDLHVTKDDSVILMHDDVFTPRTMQTTYVLGPIENFTLAQIQRNARLIHGEVLPSLTQFLDFVIDSTNLELVWLDPKVTEGLTQALSAQRTAVRRAKVRGRNLRIVFGITSEEMLAAYNAVEPSIRDSVETLVEYSPDVALSLKTCVVWTPRWTLGCDAATIATLQHAGKMVFPWTIDSPFYMSEFLDCAAYDGILSNYPAMLTGLYYRSSK
jgi:glycerophosphoryl diester phosphodiesterase